MSILSAFSLEGKTALVTGAARGLGQAMAIGLAEAGADLMLVDCDSLDVTSKEIEKLARKCGQLIVDLSTLKKRQAAELVEDTVKALGGLDIMVNNAGIIRRHPTVEFSEADWEEVVNLNLSSVFYLCQAAGKYFAEQNQSGKIINMASMLSFQGGFMVPSYTATKSALAGLTRALANEWASRNINVNAIAPGYFITEVTAGIRSDELRNKAVLDRIPAGRYGTPDELKGIVVFLASAASDYLHGAVLPIDGGWLSR
ncbi:MAG: 2-dehydro-3-deoxy-D-gluconate 5-dehydrogenase KduD [Saprospiraceae bacterium]|nr:2-dehydro-3-deoxy-D-gluconate 5-dehydrogenase KduD [Saprospiraceae bacterium]